MSASDVLVAAIVLAAAVWLLWRSLARTRGGCPGCRSACGAREPGALVRLGSGDALSRKRSSSPASRRA